MGFESCIAQSRSVRDSSHEHTTKPNFASGSTIDACQHTNVWRQAAIMALIPVRQLPLLARWLPLSSQDSSLPFQRLFSRYVSKSCAHNITNRVSGNASIFAPFAFTIQSLLNISFFHFHFLKNIPCTPSSTLASSLRIQESINVNYELGLSRSVID
jgi:hypothetical protein